MIKILPKIAAFFGKKSSSVVAPKAMQEAFSSGHIPTCRSYGIFAKAQQKAVNAENVGKIIDKMG